MPIQPRRSQLLLLLACVVASWLPARAACADDPIFSGPQVGEPLPRFIVRGAFDDQAGKEIDFVAQAADQPIVLIFIHDATRPSIAMTRILSAYTLARAEDGLRTGVVWLEDDATAAENTLKRIRHALTPGVPTGVSLDGREGPGSYGLNRNVMLTILVANKGKVTANFALVQPSIQADLPKVLKAIVDVVGGTAPKLEELPGVAEMMRSRAEPQPDSELRTLMRSLIRKEATPSEVDAAADRIEKYVADHATARKEIGRIASTIVSSGKLTNYGTERAQQILQKWAKQYGAQDPAASAAPPKPDNSK